MSIRQDFINTAMQQLVGKQEAEFKAALDATLPGWRLVDIKTRCQLIRVVGSPVETLCLDGKPLLQIHPLESHVETNADGYVVKYTKKFRSLVAATPDTPE